MNCHFFISHTKLPSCAIRPHLPPGTRRTGRLWSHAQFWSILVAWCGNVTDITCKPITRRGLSFTWPAMKGKEKTPSAACIISSYTDLAILQRIQTWTMKPCNNLHAWILQIFISIQTIENFMTWKRDETRKMIFFIPSKRLISADNNTANNQKNYPAQNPRKLSDSSN